MMIQLLLLASVVLNVSAQESMYSHARIQREGGQGPRLPPLKITKYEFLSNSAPDPLKNHKATKPAFNVGQSSALKRSSARWRANDDPLKVVF